MKDAQLDQLIAALGKMCDALAPLTGTQVQPQPARKAPPTPYYAGRDAGHREALGAVLEALDGWIEGAMSNHEASGHRHENKDEECWRSFAPQDIRNMVHDAARQVSASSIKLPKIGREDLPL